LSVAPQTTAIILAAGRGRRLGREHEAPKVLLEFAGMSLLGRHLAALQRHGIDRISITVGYQEAAIIAELRRLGLLERVHLVRNPDFTRGSLLSLAVQDADLRSGRRILLMDGDVLYDDRMITALLEAPGENILLLDREIEPGDEPVKICFRGEAIVDFRKLPERPHDRYGESVGFFRLSAEMAGSLAACCGKHVGLGHVDLEYEEALRDLILAEPGRFAAQDVTGLPWIEIDFPADVARARDDVLQKLLPQAHIGGAAAAS
jgi:choline kinase